MKLRSAKRSSKSKPQIDASALARYGKRRIQIPLRNYLARDKEGNSVGKLPGCKGWTTRKFNNANVIHNCVLHNINVGWRLKPEDVVLDVDPRNGGLQSFALICHDAPFDASKFVRVDSGRGDGGFHLYMTKKAGQLIRETLPEYPGLELKSFGRQVVCAGSLHHKTGKHYAFAKDGPQIEDGVAQTWLGRVTGKEAEDLSRHDKWLCMIYPRLRLLKEFLSPDGFILVSIDDIELARLKMVMDEIFHPTGFISCFVWKSRKFVDSRSTTNVSNDHEYVLAYRMSDDARFRGTERDEEKFDNPDSDPRGLWMSRSILGLANAKQRPNLHYPITDPVTKFEFQPPADKGWRYGRDRMEQMIVDGRILFPKKKDGRPREKKFKDDLLNQFMAMPSVIDDVHTADGSDEIRELFGRQAFDFPKPSALIEKFFEQVAEGQCLVLDSFAGSGTSGHAALKLRSKGIDCRFILIEMDQEIAHKITAERLKRVIEGYDLEKRDGSIERVFGIGGGFRYCTLGEALFDADGNVSPSVEYPDLAAHVFFCETGSPLPVRVPHGGPLIGTFQGRAIYLLYAPESVGVANARSGNVLTTAMLEKLTLPNNCAGERIVYAEGCTIPEERLIALGVTFKQVPYQIEGI